MLYKARPHINVIATNSHAKIFRRIIEIITKTIGMQSVDMLTKEAKLLNVNLKKL